MTNFTNTSIKAQTKDTRNNIPFAIAMVITVILSIFGMAFVSYVIHKNNLLKMKVWFYLFILTLSDTSLSLFAVPIVIAACVKENILYIRWLCNINGFSIMFFGIWSTLTLAAISLQKYLTISRPLKSFDGKGNCFKVIYFLVAFIISFSFAICPVLGFSRYSYMKDRQWCIVFVSSNPIYDEYLSFLVAIVGYLIPMFVIIISSVRIYAFVRKQAIKRENMQRRSSAIGHAEERVVLKTLLLIAITFFVLWTPLLVLLFLGMARVNLPSWYSHIAYSLMFAKGSLNPFIYCNRHRAFKKEFKRIFCITPSPSAEEKGDPYLEMRNRARTTESEYTKDTHFIESSVISNTQSYLSVEARSNSNISNCLSNSPDFTFSDAISCANAANYLSCEEN